MGEAGWFGYTPHASAPGPSPEELAEAAAQRSVPSTGVRRVSEDSSDADLYDAFIEFLGCYGMASEVSPGVIRVDIADDV